MNQPSILRHSKAHRAAAHLLKQRKDELLVFEGPIPAIIESAKDAHRWAKDVAYGDMDYGKKGYLHVWCAAGGVLFPERCSKRGLKLVSRTGVIRRTGTIY